MKVSDTAEFALFEVTRIKPRLMFGGERTVEDEIERALAFARDRLARLDSRMSDAYHLFNGRIDGYNIDLDSLVDTDYGLTVTVPTAAGTPGKIGVDAAVLAPLLDHGLLAGKGDDDHTQYLLADGSRSMSGDLRTKRVEDLDGDTFVRLQHPSTGDDDLLVLGANGNEVVYIEGSSYNFLPWNDAGTDLGDADHRFKDLYLVNDLLLDGNSLIVFDAITTLQVGSGGAGILALADNTRSVLLDFTGVSASKTLAFPDENGTLATQAWAASEVDTDVATHAGLTTGVHGVSGTVLGSEDIGSTVQAFDAVLDDLSALSVVADNEFIVGTGAGTYAHESGATARGSLGVYSTTEVDSADDSHQAAAEATAAAALAAHHLSTSTDHDDRYYTEAEIDSTISGLSSVYQPLDAELTALAAISSADGNFIVGSATGWVAESGATARASMGVYSTTEVDALIPEVPTVGIADGNVPPIDATAGAPNDDEFARFTASGLEGRTAAEVRADLDLEVGTDLQAWDGDLDTLAGLAGSGAGSLVYLNGLSQYDKLAAGAQDRFLRMGASLPEWRAGINDGDWSGTDLAVANGGTGASDAATARSNLGLKAVRKVQDGTLAAFSGTTTVALTNTLPAPTTGGTTGPSFSFTPTSTGSEVQIHVNLIVSGPAGTLTVWLARTTGTAVTLAVAQVTIGTNGLATIDLLANDSPASTSAQTYQIRFGCDNAGTSYVNRWISQNPAQGKTSVPSYQVVEVEP